MLVLRFSAWQGGVLVIGATKREWSFEFRLKEGLGKTGGWRELNRCNLKELWFLLETLFFFKAQIKLFPRLQFQVVFIHTEFGSEKGYLSLHLLISKFMKMENKDQVTIINDHSDSSLETEYLRSQVAQLLQERETHLKQIQYLQTITTKRVKMSSRIPIMPW